MGTHDWFRASLRAVRTFFALPNVAVAFCALLGVASMAPSCPTTGTTIMRDQMPAYRLASVPGDAILEQAEIASAVVPPGANGNCPNGAVALTWGQFNEHYVMRTDLSCIGTATCSQGSDRSISLPNPGGKVWVSSNPAVDPTTGRCDLTLGNLLFVDKYLSASADVGIVSLPGGRLGHGRIGKNLQEPFLWRARAGSRLHHGPVERT